MSFPAALPASRVADPKTAPWLRWGVIGTGWIAERFVDSLQRLTNQRAVAVGSRSLASATSFAGRFYLERAHGSYEDLVGDPEVDVVYVATPHNLHLPHATLALEAGKHVLVEKPIGLNAAQARAIADLAAARGLFAAEALWTLFLPKYDVLRQILDQGWLGEIRTVLADHGEWFADDHRIMSHELAGGPLLDLGTYPLMLAGWILGTPSEIVARGVPAHTGVNGQTSALLAYADGAQAVINTTILSNTPTGASISGTGGTITIPGVFYRPGGFVVESADHAHRLQFSEPDSAYDGLAYEAAEVARRISEGELETPIRPLADSIATLAVVDEIRRQIGVVFNEER